MRLYSLQDPVNLECARVAPVGDTGYIKCTTCGYYTSYPRPAKRVVRWLEGSIAICPFVWTSRLIAEVLITEQVQKALQGSEVEFIPVEFYQDPKLGKPKRVTKRTKPRVWLPYQGPPLCDLWVTTWVNANLERSSLRLVSSCPVCAHKAYEVEGIEERRSQWDPIKRRLVEIHTPRAQGKGIYVWRRDLQSVDIFRLVELPGLILCTERVKVLIEEKRFTNVSFLEVGETLR
jgi:hypothetical protein